MRRYVLCIFFAAAAMSIGCSKSEAPDDAADGTVRFLAGLNGREDDWSGYSTRGAPLDNMTISQFGVFCYNTGRTKWATAAATALPNKMCDVSVIRNGNDWSYDPPVKWEGGDGAYFTFFGYSPRAAGIFLDPDNLWGNNLELTTKATDFGTPGLQYATLDYVPAQIDLLVSVPIYDTYPVAKVPMKFAHALSQISFMAWSAQDFVRVKRIEISNIQYSATLSLEGGLTPLNDVKTFLLDDIDQNLSTDQTKMTNLSSGDNAFLLLPQNLTGNTIAKIVVTYVTSAGEEGKSTPYLIKENWGKGKSYTYTLKLGGNPTAEMVVSGVTITDWLVDSSEDLNTGGGSAEQI